MCVCVCARLPVLYLRIYANEASFRLDREHVNNIDQGRCRRRRRHNTQILHTNVIKRCCAKNLVRSGSLQTYKKCAIQASLGSAILTLTSDLPAYGRNN